MKSTEVIEHEGKIVGFIGYNWESFLSFRDDVKNLIGWNQWILYKESWSTSKTGMVSKYTSEDYT